MGLQREVEVRTMQIMAKKPDRKTDRHKKGKAAPATIRLKHRHRKALEKLVELFGSDLTEEIHTAIRERAERHNVWPPVFEPEEDA